MRGRINGGQTGRAHTRCWGLSHRLFFLSLRTHPFTHFFTASIFFSSTLTLMPILSSSNHCCVRIPAASGNDLCCSFKLICGGTYGLLLISSLRCMISICDPTLQPAQNDSCPLEIAHFIIYCLRLCSLSLHPHCPFPVIWWTLSHNQRFDWPAKSTKLSLRVGIHAVFLSVCPLSLPAGWTQIPQLLPPRSSSCWLLVLNSSVCWVPLCRCLSGCAERWRSLCGAWWSCWHVSSPLDAATVRGNVWPVDCSCSNSSWNKPSTPWWAHVCIIVILCECMSTPRRMCAAAASHQHPDGAMMVIQWVID